MQTATEVLAPLCSAAEAARIVGVTPQSVRVRYREGKLDGDESLGVLVVRRAALEPWIAEREQRAREMAL